MTQLIRSDICLPGDVPLMYGRSLPTKRTISGSGLRPTQTLQLDTYITLITSIATRTFTADEIVASAVSQVTGRLTDWQETEVHDWVKAFFAIDDELSKSAARRLRVRSAREESAYRELARLTPSNDELQQLVAKCSRPPEWIDEDEEEESPFGLPHE